MREKIKSPLNARHDRHGITTLRRINKKYTENHLNNSSDQLYMQLTNKHKRAMGRKVGAEEDVRAVRRKRQKYFTHVEVTRQEHRGQYWHVPLSEVDILID
jgi:hypothetical protein